MNALLREFHQCVIDAQNLIALLESNYGFSDETLVTCRYALYWYIHTCTPEESVPAFKRETEAVKRIIELEMGE